jgi:hypothetical protein
LSLSTHQISEKAANKHLRFAVSECMSNGIRIETAATTDLTHAQDWLSRHRGQTFELDRSRQLELGVPISAPRAVLVAVTLQDGGTTPQIGGVVRAIASRSDGDPVRLVFEGRSPAHLPAEEARSEALQMLDAMSGLMAEDESVAQVA